MRSFLISYWRYDIVGIWTNRLAEICQKTFAIMKSTFAFPLIQFNSCFRFYQNSMWPVFSLSRIKLIECSALNYCNNKLQWLFKTSLPSSESALIWKNNTAFIFKNCLEAQISLFCCIQEKFESSKSDTKRTFLRKVAFFFTESNVPACACGEGRNNRSKFDADFNRSLKERLLSIVIFVNFSFFLTGDAWIITSLYGWSGGRTGEWLRVSLLTIII